MMASSLKASSARSRSSSAFRFPFYLFVIHLQGQMYNICGFRILPRSGGAAAGFSVGFFDMFCADSYSIFCHQLWLLLLFWWGAGGNLMTLVRHFLRNIYLESSCRDGSSTARSCFHRLSCFTSFVYLAILPSKIAPVEVYGHLQAIFLLKILQLRWGILFHLVGRQSLCRHVIGC